MATQTLDASPADSTTPPVAWRVAALIALSVILNTLIGAFTGEKTRFLIKNDLGLSASGQATLAIIVGIPGYLRPFMGAWSDIFPIFGLHRRPYYALSWLVYGLGLLGVSALHEYHYWTVVFLAIVTGAGGNLLFVIMDAVMVAIGNQTGTVPRLQTIQQAVPGIMAATFIGPLTGYLTQHHSNHFDFLWGGILALLGIPLAWLIQERRVTGPRQTIDPEAQRAERGRTLVALRNAVSSPGLWAMVGFVFYLIITPGINIAQFNYQVDVLHFDKQFIGTLIMPASIGGFVGFAIFLIAGRFLPVRALVWGAYLMDCSIYLISFGLRDHPSAIFVGAFTGAVGTIYNLSLLTLAARATPPGVEGAIYGLVIAAINLGGTLGDQIGSSIYDAFGPAAHHSITYGWHALLWLGFGFTVIAAVFIPFLPAWAKSNEPLRPKPETIVPGQQT